jgi:hypothetical protein
MADKQNDRDRDNENIGDESEDQNRTNRQQGSSRSNAQEEPTDTLEDRNLSGASTWATLPENQPEESADDEGNEPGQKS